MLHRVQSAVLLLVLRHGHGRDLESPDNTSVWPTLGDLRVKDAVGEKSLANLTSSSSETIAPHGVDCIVAGLIHRSRQARALGVREILKAKTIDLCKAYKQLPLSEKALHDSWICVLNPETKQPEAFRSRVLPFGSRPSVVGFCRTSHCLWFLGVHLFRLHWTCYFDDYVLVACEQELEHLNLIQSGFFSMMGWNISAEKEGGFQAIARALGVEINLSDFAAGLFKVCNTAARQRELAASISDMLEKGSGRWLKILKSSGVG